MTMHVASQANISEADTVTCSTYKNIFPPLKSIASFSQLQRLILKAMSDLSIESLKHAFSSCCSLLAPFICTHSYCFGICLSSLTR